MVTKFGDAYLYSGDLPGDLQLDGDLAVDTEAMGLNNRRDRLCLVQISTGDGKAHLVNFTRGQYEAPNLKKVLTNPDKMKIFHYARFDLAVMQCYLDIQLTNVYCTKLASRLCRTYTDSHSLKDLCYDMLGVKISKMQQSSDWGSLKLTPPQVEYAASDVLYLHKLRDRLNSMLEREGRTAIAVRCFEFLPTRAALDLAGWADFDIYQHGSAKTGGFTGGSGHGG